MILAGGFLSFVGAGSGQVGVTVLDRMQPEPLGAVEVGPKDQIWLSEGLGLTPCGPGLWGPQGGSR